MKKLLVLLSVLAFAFTAVAAMAQDNKQEKAKKPEKRVSCCIKGECKKDVTKAECAKEKGKVVADCSKCKPAKASMSTKSGPKSEPKAKPEPKLPDNE
jgi:hypothetical protein